ncbi:MAG: hypothetical protein KKE20_07120 [Nanoarchaeota archaeon]|nr:hypothetical protein [Nanoarchaeota archaeon]
MAKKRSQAAMEFLLTYGWAIIVVLVVIGALGYFGVLDPTMLLPEKCTIEMGPLTCNDVVVYNVKETRKGYIFVDLKNILDQGYTIKHINITGKDFRCFTDMFYSRDIKPGKEQCIGFSCTTPGSRRGKKAFDMQITYSQKDGLNKTLFGQFYSAIQQVDKFDDVYICNFGDGNADGVIDENDLTLIRELIIGMHGYDPILVAAYDMDGDGYIGPGDLMVMQTAIFSCTCCTEEEKFLALQKMREAGSWNIQSVCYSTCGIAYDNCNLPVYTDLTDGMISLQSVEGYKAGDKDLVFASLYNKEDKPIAIKSVYIGENNNYCYQTYSKAPIIPGKSSACVIVTCPAALQEGTKIYRSAITHTVPDRVSSGYAAGNISMYVT